MLGPVQGTLARRNAPFVFQDMRFSLMLANSYNSPETDANPRMPLAAGLYLEQIGEISCPRFCAPPQCIS